MDAQELIKQTAQRIQSLDEQIKEIQELKKDVLKQAKDEGLNSTILSRAISEIRRDKKQTPAEKAEEEMYRTLIEPLISILE